MTFKSKEGEQARGMAKGRLGDADFPHKEGVR
jgi:hypothetical protein